MNVARDRVQRHVGTVNYMTGLRHVKPAPAGRSPPLVRSAGKASLFPGVIRPRKPVLPVRMVLLTGSRRFSRRGGRQEATPGVASAGPILPG